jgi:large subunit ribosomal protein L10
MAISKDKKESLVADLTQLLTNAKLTVYAQYNGLSVADLQTLRALAREAGVQIKVVKNRLVRVALGQIAVYKDTDTTGLEGQLLYALSDSDEVAPASVLDKFAKTHDMLKIVGGISSEGANLDTDAVNSLAKLPSKQQLIAEVVAQLLSPVTDIESGLSGNLHGMLDAIATKNA